MTTGERLDIFAIYESPSDYTGKFVVRGWAVNADGSVRPDRFPLAVVDTLDLARESVPADLVRVERSPSDDPCIVETWV